MSSGEVGRLRPACNSIRMRAWPVSTSLAASSSGECSIE
jgi:hypothetical protein